MSVDGLVDSMVYEKDVKSVVVLVVVMVDP